MNVCIHSGVCGFITTVQAETDSDYQTKLQVESQCPNVKKIIEALGTLNVMNELFRKGQSEILSLSAQHLPHVTCPVPIGMLKALEASAGMALPKDVSISFTK
ncbi:DUF6951 family protein [Candidatus Formimonas warabiya]|nr:hypothetical protein [Candidatus Formimonas warabiya]